MTTTTVSALDKVDDFLAEPLRHFIGGAWQESHDGATREVENPSDGTILATVADGGKSETNAAVEAANAAFPSWAALHPDERSVLLHRLADLMERDVEVLARLEALDVGKTLAAAEGFDIPFGIECMRYFADLAPRVRYDLPLALKQLEARSHLVPYGVCGFIFPWNFPFDLLMWGIAPALAAGNTVVVKPSEVTPLTTLYTCALLEELGFPAGVINVVVGHGPAAGAAIPEHPLVRRMSFTGSPEVGRQIGGVAGSRPIPCKLELGGKGAAVVFDDVDVDAVAGSLADALTLNTGQVCCTATRWIVHESVYDDFVDRVSDKLTATRVGPSLDPATQMGPLVSAVQKKRVLGYLERGVAEGASVVLAGGDTTLSGHERGHYVTPYLLAGDEQNVCFREEIFGPAAYLTRFRDEQDAVTTVNSLTYGLANSVWSNDLERANRVAERMVAGNSWINAHNVFAYGLPYAGYGLSGVGGGVNSPETFFDYLRPQTIARPL
jgi:aldehyde dehydrogenase (NAD+)